MGTKNYDNAADLITFSRASGGTSLRKISYGSELVTNGTFDSDIVGWADASSVGGSIAWNASGYIDLVNSTGAPRARTSFATEIGKVYIISVETVSETGLLNVGTSAGSGTYVDENSIPVGVETFIFTAASTTCHVQLANIFAGTIAVMDNISVKEVLFDQPDGTLTLFNHPDNIPRIDYNPDGTVKGLLIEEARTNLVTYSEDFTDASWSKTDADVTANVTGPDGVANSATVLEATNTSFPQIRLSATISATTDHTHSVYVKAGTSNWMYMLFSNFTSPLDFDGAWFDLSLGEVGTVQGTGVTAKIEDVGAGWYRCSVSWTSGADTIGNLVCRNVVGDGVTSTAVLGSTLIIFGYQLEAGSFPTSYIPTSGSTATRAADIASIPVTDFGYNQDQGTVYVNGTFRDTETIVTVGSTTLAADADGEKDYATTYSSDPSATSIELNGGTYENLQYYPRKLTAAQITELTT